MRDLVLNREGLRAIDKSRPFILGGFSFQTSKMDSIYSQQIDSFRHSSGQIPGSSACIIFNSRISSNPYASTCSYRHLQFRAPSGLGPSPSWPGREGIRSCPLIFTRAFSSARQSYLKARLGWSGGGWWGTKEKVLCRKRQAPRRAMPSQDP